MKHVVMTTRLDVFANETQHGIFHPAPDARLFRLHDVRLLEGDPQSPFEARPLESYDLVDVEAVFVANCIMTRWQRRLPILRPDEAITVAIRNFGEVARSIVVAVELEPIEVVDVAFEEVDPLAPGVGP